MTARFVFGILGRIARRAWMVAGALPALASSDPRLRTLGAFAAGFACAMVVLLACVDRDEES